MKDSDYALILESDAIINPKATNVTDLVKFSLDLSLKENKGGNGFVYFGLCGGHCASFTTISNGSIVGSDCGGIKY